MRLSLLGLRGAFFGLGLSVSTVVNAGVLYTQALYNLPYGNGGPNSNYGSQLIANAFRLSGGGVIEAANWYGAAYNLLPFGDFNVAFFGDSAGHPGALLSVDTVAPTIVDTGLSDAYGDEVYRFSTATTTFRAAAGVTYYFSVSDLGSPVSDDTPSNFVWANSDLLARSYYSRAGVPGPWTLDSVQDFRQSQAFTLEGSVPEPPIWTLLLAGFGVLGAMARRRRRRGSQRHPNP